MRTTLVLLAASATAPRAGFMWAIRACTGSAAEKFASRRAITACRSGWPIRAKSAWTRSAFTRIARGCCGAWARNRNRARRRAGCRDAPEPGDAFLLASDGFWEWVLEAEMEATLAASKIRNSGWSGWNRRSSSAPPESSIITRRSRSGVRYESRNLVRRMHAGRFGRAGLPGVRTAVRMRRRRIRCRCSRARMLHDQYLIGRALGHGGFGVTYLAWDTGLATRLAVKEYLPHGVAGRAANTTQVMAYSDSTKAEFEWGLERFLEEARTLKKFKNFPGIVSIDTVFRDNGTAYLVMEYLDGSTFEDFLNNAAARFRIQTALRLCCR